VITYDLPGHGLSNGSPANIQNFDHYQQVLHAVYQYVKNAEQLPKPWLGVGKVQVVQFGCIIYLNMHKNVKIQLWIGCYCFHHWYDLQKQRGGIILLV
jgi:hypothetical protein